MNQRITKLVRQALNECVSTPVESVIASRIDDHGIVEIPNVFSEKFAELIVRECANAAVQKDAGMAYTADVAGHVAAGRSTAARMIKEHFGVEE